MMLFLFWGLTLVLLLLAVGLLMPWLSSARVRGLIFVGLGVFAYGVYGVLGCSYQLKHYYAMDHRVRSKLQPLVTELKKQEYRLRFHLEDYPEDMLARSQLLEILGIQALQAGNKALARRCLEEALKTMGEQGLAARKQHLLNLLDGIR